MTWEHLQRGSSPVDWCEGNYQISPNIAEFVNTFSNFIFILFPPILIHLFKDYGYFINQGIHIIWVLLIIVGLSSAYFHATLSLIGQLLDEVAILWVCSAAFSMFSPKALFPKFLKGNRNKFSAGIAIITAICTVLSVWQPAVNAFALMFLVIPATIMLYNELRVQKCERVIRLGIRCCMVLCVALICWLTDRFCCDTWFGEHFPYLHGFWHIFIFIASYTATVLFAYFAVQNDYVDRVAELKYWPVNSFEFGIPYVSVRISGKDHNI
ncbi:alkaline ceramidase [Bradysia coprophila]|uniref:alkaline ceramidase n=1 Tax=Bradysia coprophila TaxID=38358 RepID=UPI00187DCEC6|nr:alkaline ceramidase [Bradysia coprophila]